jgi:hypothetical protein
MNRSAKAGNIKVKKDLPVKLVNDDGAEALFAMLSTDCLDLDEAVRCMPAALKTCVHTSSSF